MLFYPKEEWQYVLILLEGETMESVLEDAVMFEFL